MQKLLSLTLACFLLAAVPTQVAEAQTALRGANAVETLAMTMRRNMQVCVELLRSAVMIGEWPQCGTGTGSAIQYEVEDALRSARDDTALSAEIRSIHTLYLALAGRVSPFEGEDLESYRDRILAAIDQVTRELDALVAGVD